MSATEEQNDYNPTWKPDPGDTLAGKMVDYKEIPSKYKKDDGSPRPPVPIMTLETVDGPVDVFVNAKVLEDELKRHRVQVGDSVSITYGGKKEPKGGGKAYHLYTVTGGSVRPVVPAWCRDEVQARAEAPPDVEIDDADLPDPPDLDDSVPF